jgi:hypothetical protein
MTKPIKPDEVIDKKIKSLPDIVIDTFNNAIAEAWNGKESIIYQRTVAFLIANELNISEDKVYDRGYMDIEPIYRKEGWKVQYDKPAYNETYEATYKFTK